MKKVALVLALVAIGLSSCSKEITLFRSCYCPVNQETFTLSNVDLTKANVGGYHYITNSNSWTTGSDTLTR